MALSAKQVSREQQGPCSSAPDDQVVALPYPCRDMLISASRVASTIQAASRASFRPGTPFGEIGIRNRRSRRPLGRRVTCGVRAQAPQRVGSPVCNSAWKNSCPATGDSQAVKKLRDVAGEIMSTAYDRPATRVYYIGGSKGGQEALVAAQRFGADFDGVVSYYPAKDNGALIMGWWELTQAAYFTEGGYLPPQAQHLVHARTLAACDGLDGAEDGIIANIPACEASFAPDDLLCEDGTTTDCLSPAQVATLQRGSQRLTLPYEMANGISRIGPFPVMTGGDLSGLWLSEDGSPLTPQSLFVREIARHFLTGNPDLALEDIDLAALREPMQAYGRGTDATSTDLTEFLAHEGKMILVQGTTDTRLAAGGGTATTGAARISVIERRSRTSERKTAATIVVFADRTERRFRPGRGSIPAPGPRYAWSAVRAARRRYAPPAASLAARSDARGD